MSNIDLIHFYLSDRYSLVLDVSPLLILFLIAFIVFFLWKWLSGRRRHFELVNLDIALGGVGKATFRPTIEDIQIAHRIWTELITRKAALPIDPEHDLLIEIYDSWHTLFTRVRQLIGDIPAHLVRNEKSTQELVRIATRTLNQGLRPHLTQWQARFRNWYGQQTDQLKNKSPQEVQRQFPDYETLIADMKGVNQQLIQYAGELQKIIRGQ